MKRNINFTVRTPNEFTFCNEMTFKHNKEMNVFQENAIKMLQEFSSLHANENSATL